jgi:hypothetical protein
MLRDSMKNIGNKIWFVMIWFFRLFGLLLAISQIFVFSISSASDLKPWFNLLLGVGILFWIAISIKKDIKKKTHEE